MGFEITENNKGEKEDLQIEENYYTLPFHFADSSYSVSEGITKTIRLPLAPQKNQFCYFANKLLLLPLALLLKERVILLF